MRLRLSKLQKQGAIILPCIMICGILGFTLASYFSLVRAQNRSVARSQLWNAAIPVCEAGIEEALAHINDSAIGTNYALNGWTATGNGFQMERAIGEHRYVTLISTDAYPKITAKAYIGDKFTGVDVSRGVKVTTTRWATGMKGLIAKYDIDMTSQCEIDSFDSEDARYSTRGRYDATKRKDGGFAGSVFGNVNGASIYGSTATGPSGTVTGTVGDFAWVASHTGVQPGHSANDLNLAFPEVQAPFEGGAYSPAAGSVTLTNLDYWSTMITTGNPPATTPASPITTNFYGTLTSTTYPVGVSAGLIKTNTTPMRTKTTPTAGTYLNLVTQGAWNYYDLITSYTYPSVTYTYSMTAGNTNVTTESYEYVLSAEKYQVGSLSLSGSQRLLVTGTNVTLYITGDFTMTGNSKLIITPEASLKVYVAGRTSLAGNGIFNYTLDASHFMYYGLPSNTRIDISGNAAFTGCIYAPRAEVNMNGSGNTVYDVVGAIIAKTAEMNGHFHFHYDERLGRSKILSKFTVSSWAEI